MADFPFRGKDATLLHEATTLGIDLGWITTDCEGPDDLREAISEVRQHKAADHERDKAQDRAWEAQWDDPRADPYPFKRGETA